METMETANFKARKLGKIFKKYPVKLAYVFGSVALGNDNPKSDIDIAILLNDKLSKEKRFNIRLKLAGEMSKTFQKEADVVVLNDIASLFFKYVIVKEGKLVYQLDEKENLEFENKILSRYFDFAPFLSLYNKKYVKNSV